MAETTAAPAAPVQPTTEATADAKSVNETTQTDSKQKTPEQKEAERKFKLKFGKQERELSEKDLVAFAQKGWAADEKFQSAAQKQKEVDAFINKMQNDPDAFDDFIKFLGKDPDEIYKKQLSKSLKRKVMTPEEVEREELRSKVQKYEAEKKEAEQRAHEEQVQALQEKYEQQYDREMSEAIATSGLPKTAKTVKRCAEIMYRSLQHGYDLPWNIVIEQVKSEYQNDMREMFSAADAESLVKLFGDDVAKKFTSASLKKRAVDPEPVNENTRSAAKSAKEDGNQQKYMSEDDFEERMKKFKNS